MSVLPALHRNHTLFELPLYFCQFSWVACIVQIFKTISIRTDWTIGCFFYFVLWLCQWKLYIAWIYHLGLHWNCIWMVLCKFSFRYNSSWIVSTIAISIRTDWTIGYTFFTFCVNLPIMKAVHCIHGYISSWTPLKRLSGTLSDTKK